MTSQEEINARIERSRQRRLADPNHPTKMPLPNNIEASDEMKELAMTIVTDNKKSLAIRYIRSEPTIAYNKDDKGRKVPTIAAGRIIGAVIGMKNSVTGEVRIGWSKRFDGEVFREGKLEPGEFMTSTKDRALFAAVLRGLVDSITVKSRNYGESSNGTIIPALVVREMDSFCSRVTKYFGKKPSNLVFEEFVKVEAVKEVSAG